MLRVQKGIDNYNCISTSSHNNNYVHNTHYKKCEYQQWHFFQFVIKGWHLYFGTKYINYICVFDCHLHVYCSDASRNCMLSPKSGRVITPTKNLNRPNVGRGERMVDTTWSIYPWKTAVTVQITYLNDSWVCMLYGWDVCIPQNVRTWGQKPSERPIIRPNGILKIVKRNRPIEKS